MDVYGLGCIVHDLACINTGVEGDEREPSESERSGVTFDQTHMTVDTDRRMLCIIIKRRLLNFQPCIPPRVPQALATLLRALLAVEAEDRPSAEAARTSLASLAADSVTWGAEGVPPQASH